MVFAPLLLAVLAVLARAKNIDNYSGIQSLLNFEGQPKLLNFEGPQKLLNFEKRENLLNFDGQPKLLNFEKRENLLNFDGQPKLLNFDGQPKLLNLDGQPKLLNFEKRQGNLLNFDRVRNLLKFDGTDSEEDDFDPRVIGGRDALDGEFPFMVSLHYRGRFICSSFLITPNILMTAAHCVVFGSGTEDPKHYTGYAGTIQRDGPETEIRFTEIVAHSEYGSDTEYDIALMRLAKPLQVGDKIKTVCLPTEGSVFEDTTAQIVGWGVADKRARDSAKILQTATEKVPTNERCAYIYNILGIPVTSRHVCAGGERDKGVCFGDSGGPLVVTDDSGPMAVGVASFVSNKGCAKRHIPAVYTAVAPYLDWVKEKMGEGDAADLCLRPKSSRR